MLRFATILLFIMFASAVYANNSCPNQLFYIAKSTNENIVMYELNLSSEGRINEISPIRSYWTRLGAGTERKLGFLERKLAYGVRYLNEDNDKFLVVAFPKQILELGAENGCTLAYTVIDGEKAKLDSVFADVEGSGLSTVVHSLTLTGVALSSGEAVSETIESEEIE